MKYLYITLLIFLFGGCAAKVDMSKYHTTQSQHKELREKPILHPNQVNVKSNVHNISNDWLNGLVETNSKLKEYFDTYNKSDLKLDITLLNYGYTKSFKYYKYGKTKYDTIEEDCDLYKDIYLKRQCYTYNRKQRAKRIGHWEIDFYSKMKISLNGNEPFYINNFETLVDKHSSPYDNYNTNYNMTMVIQGNYNKIFTRVREKLREPFDITEIRKGDNDYLISINGGTCNYMYKGQSVRIFSNSGSVIGTGEIVDNSTCNKSWILLENIKREPKLSDKVGVLFMD